MAKRLTDVSDVEKRRSRYAYARNRERKPEDGFDEAREAIDPCHRAECVPDMLCLSCAAALGLLDDADDYAEAGSRCRRQGGQ